MGAAAAAAVVVLVTWWSLSDDSKGSDETSKPTSSSTLAKPALAPTTSPAAIPPRTDDNGVLGTSAPVLLGFFDRAQALSELPDIAEADRPNWCNEFATKLEVTVTPADVLEAATGLQNDELAGVVLSARRALSDALTACVEDNFAESDRAVQQFLELTETFDQLRTVTS